MSPDRKVTLHLSDEEVQLVKLALDREGNRQVEIDNLDAANFLYELADKIRHSFNWGGMYRKMIVSKEIQKKMHKLAKLISQASILDREINDYFEMNGYDIDELRAGNGNTLDELNYGNDITDQFVEDMKNDKYTKVGD